jgi:pyruvate carboxylase
MGAVQSALKGSPFDLGISFDDIQILNSYWEQVRLLYKCFDPNVNSPSSEVYLHEMPGGQYTNLLFQATSLGLGTKWTEIKKAYVMANRLCGDIVKVTPSSKVVGDLAQ